MSSASFPERIRIRRGHKTLSCLRVAVGERLNSWLLHPTKPLEQEAPRNPGVPFDFRPDIHDEIAAGCDHLVHFNIACTTPGEVRPPDCLLWDVELLVGEESGPLETLRMRDYIQEDYVVWNQVVGKVRIPLLGQSLRIRSGIIPPRIGSGIGSRVVLDPVYFHILVDLAP